MSELTPRMKELVQPYLAGIEPYDPNFTPTRINLSANENTYPVPAGVREAVDAVLAATPLNRYPDPMSNDLRDELAAWHGVARENVCVGNGGDELLYNYLLAFGGVGRTLLNCPPCFSEYAFFASLCQTEVRDVWRDPATFELDQAAALAAAPECNLAIVTSPNNPTGDVAPLDFVAALCDACPGMVMVDEAYVEFADDSFGAATTAQGLIAEHPNLVILHTLSKAFGAAGTRLGYVIAAPEVIDVFAAIRQIYSVNVLSQAAALACVRARDAYAPVVAQVASERETRAVPPCVQWLPRACPWRRGRARRTLCSCARRMPRACANVCAMSIRFWCATLAMRRALRTVCALPWVPRRKTMRCWLRLPRW